jgi:sec-independent protein translocase protein TatA
MGSTELLIILLIVVLVFGASAIPKLAKSVGEARREFENASKDINAVKEKNDGDQ